MRRLDGKIAIVTGGGGGIGGATAVRLAAEGAAVVVADIDEAKAVEIADRIVADDGTARPFHVDVAEQEQVAAMVAYACSEFGGLDILHNNAGGTDADLVGRDRELADVTLELWNRTLAVNLTSAMLAAQLAVPRMIERGGGAIVNTSSNSGAAGDVVRAAYGAAKAGMNNLTMTIAAMFGKQNIRCNAVSPGFIVTPVTPRHIPDSMLEAYRDAQMLPRLGVAEDIASVVAFLASDDAAYVTGQVIHVDGGQLAHLPPSLLLR